MTWNALWVATAVVITMAAAAPVLAIGILAPEPGSPEPSAFSAGSHNLSALASGLKEAGLDVKAVVASAQLLDEHVVADETLLFMVAPSQAPTDEDIVRLLGFLERGGTIWIADPEGVSNRFLGLFGVSIADKRLIGPDGADAVGLVPRNLTDVSLPVAATDPGRLYFEDDRPWVVVLEGPAALHLDIDGNGSIDRADTPGPHPVVARLELETGGALVAAADASLLATDAITNATTGNLVFVRSLVGALLDDGTVVFDETDKGLRDQEPYIAPLVAWSTVLGSVSPWVYVAFAFLVAAGAAATAVYGPRWKPFPPHRFHIPIDRAPPPRQPAIIPDPEPELEQINQGEEQP